MRIAGRVLMFLAVLLLVFQGIVFAFYFLAPRSNAKLGKVDTLIVLGCPTNADGSPSPEQRARVMEGVRQFQAGVSGHIIMTGTAAHNRFVEAHAMAMLAEANGVPASAVLEEDRAHTTIQNIYYADKIMLAHGWHTAEVISSPYHLPRTALILAHYPRLEWETHASPWPPNYGWLRKFELEWREANGCFRYRVHGFPRSPFLPEEFVAIR